MLTTAVGRQVEWYLGCLATRGERAAVADADRLTSAMPGLVPAAATQDELRHQWRVLSKFFPSRLLDAVASSDFRLTVRLVDDNGRHWRLTVAVEETPPHRISALRWEREFGAEVTVREATEEDGAALADLERRCPIVLDGRSITFDRGDDYFTFARLAAGCTVVLGCVAGVPAAVNCATLRTVQIGGRPLRILTGMHTRVLPEHQGKGLWPTVSGVLLEKYPFGSCIDATMAVSAVENRAFHRAMASFPTWPVQAVRAHLSTAALAGPRAGRQATPADAGAVVEMLNASHGGEELYLPYTEELLIERLTRAPELYSWERIWLGDGAVVGVWPSGTSIRVIEESSTGRREWRRGLVLDYGFHAGAEAELEALIRAWCGWLAERGQNELCIFTSAGSAGEKLLTDLAERLEAFDVWTAGVEPPRAVDHGLYIDPIYF
ncbi:MAG: hypothetical protein ACRD0C_05800 [Acidimicrobiia bacterium]